MQIRIYFPSLVLTKYFEGWIFNKITFPVLWMKQLANLSAGIHHLGGILYL